MSPSKKARKLRPVEVSQALLPRARLQQCTLEHKHISGILRESDKWLKVAEIRNPKTDGSKLIEKLLNRKNELEVEIRKLRKTLSGFQPIPDFDGKRERTELPPIDGGVIDPRDPEFRARIAEVAAILEHFDWRHRGWRWRWVPDTECGPESGLITLSEDPEYLDILQPSFSTTNSQRTFTVLETVDYCGVSFADMFIDVSDAAIDLYDSFEVASVLKFVFPPAPCDGILFFYLGGQVALSPEVDGDSGIVRVAVKYRFVIDGTDPDPNNINNYFTITSLGTSSPYFAGTIRRNVTLDFRNVGFQVRQGQRGVLRLAVPVLMGIGGGRSSFSQNGAEPVGHMLIMVPPGASGPGVSYNFVPNE